jgi:hypothetical protein
MGVAIRVADGVIFVTPEHTYSVPGALRTPSTGSLACPPLHSPETP